MLQIVLEVKAMNESDILQIEDYCQVSPELSWRASSDVRNPNTAAFSAPYSGQFNLTIYRS